MTGRWYGVVSREIELRVGERARLAKKGSVVNEFAQEYTGQVDELAEHSKCSPESKRVQKSHGELQHR